MTFMKYSIRGLFESFSFRAHETYVLDSAKAKRPPLTIYLLRHVISVVEALADCGRGFSQDLHSFIDNLIDLLRYAIFNGCPTYWAAIIYGQPFYSTVFMKQMLAW